MLQLGGKAGLQSAKLGDGERGQVDYTSMLVGIALVVWGHCGIVGGVRNVPVPGGAPPELEGSAIVVVCGWRTLGWRVDR